MNSKTAKPSHIFIIYGIVKAYVKNPIRFMVGLLVTFPKFLKSIKVDLPKDFIISNAFIVHLYHRLQIRFEKENAYEITRAAILCSALAVMQANFRTVEAARNYENLIKYQKQAKEEGITKLNEMKIVKQTELCYEFYVTKCVFFEFFTYMGTPELTKIMCAADNAIFNTYLPNEIVFDRALGETMPEGAMQCHFCIIFRN